MNTTKQEKIMNEGWDDIYSEGWDLIEGDGPVFSQDLNPIRL